MSGLFAGPVALVSVWRERGHPPGALRALATLGAVQLALLWLGFIPLALLNRALGEPFILIFGSYTQSTSLIDYAAAANLAVTCMLLVGVACSDRLTWALRSSGLLMAVLLAFTAFEEAGLNKAGPRIPFPSDALHAPSVPIAYSVGGVLVLLGGVILWAGKRVRSHPRSRFLIAILTAPHIVALGLTTATLAQHPLFEEVAELAFSAAVLQVLAAIAVLTRSSRLEAPTRTAVVTV